MDCRSPNRDLDTGVDGGWAEEGPACADPGARTPVGASGNFIKKSQKVNALDLDYPKNM